MITHAPLLAVYLLITLVARQQPTNANTYLLVIVVHEMHGRIHHNYWQITIVLVHDPLSLSDYIPHGEPHPSCDRQFAYKNFRSAVAYKCYFNYLIITNFIAKVHVLSRIFDFYLNESKLKLDLTNELSCIS